MDNHHDKPTWLERLSHALLREPQDRAQLMDILRDAKKRHLLDNDALHMIEGVLQVSEMHVRDVSVPRTQMVVINHDSNNEDALRIVIDAGHSRFPVVGDDRDEIVGILLAKDLLKVLSNTQQKAATIKSLLRPATFIPESKRLDVLLKEFRLNRNHMAIVVDEYGGVAGLVTIEDVLEQIVGDIEDEYDTEEEEQIKLIKDSRYSVQALTPIDKFNEHFGTNYDHNDFDTAGGLVLQKFSHLPKPGESIEFDGLKVKIIQANPRGIQLLRVTVLNKTEARA